ncbi:MAG: alpha/beta hydrolase family protein [Promethearchaeota archaeon]
MEFKEKQYDGPYEVCGVEITCNNQLFRGVLYHPPDNFKKPHPLIIYFHGFPQIFTLEEIVKTHAFLLNKGFSFLAFNFRGYRYSEGKVSIKSQVEDSIEVIQFAETLAKHGIFDKNYINILANDFGGYIALILCSKKDIINKVLLLCPVLNVRERVYSEDFTKVLQYLNRFLPGHVKGIENPEEFIKLTKEELEREEFQIEKIISQLKNKELKVIIGENDKICTPDNIQEILKNSNIEPQITIIKEMEHEILDYDEYEKIREEIDNFFTKKF